MNHATAEVVDTQTNGFETAFTITVDNRYMSAVKDIFDAVERINEKAEKDEDYQRVVQALYDEMEEDMDRKHMDFLERKNEMPYYPDEVDYYDDYRMQQMEDEHEQIEDEMYDHYEDIGETRERDADRYYANDFSE